jgi:hypothetical protein
MDRPGGIYRNEAGAAPLKVAADMPPPETLLQRQTTRVMQQVHRLYDRIGDLNSLANRMFGEAPPAPTAIAGTDVCRPVEGAVGDIHEAVSRLDHAIDELGHALGRFDGLA